MALTDLSRTGLRERGNEETKHLCSQVSIFRGLWVMIRKWGKKVFSLTLRSSHLSFEEQTLNHNSVELEELGNWGTDGEIWLPFRQWAPVPRGQGTACLLLGLRALDQRHFQSGGTSLLSAEAEPKESSHPKTYLCHCQSARVPPACLTPLLVPFSTSS